MNVDRAHVAERLNLLPFVSWDRFVVVPAGENGEHEALTAYGWIGRDDGRSDFVVVEFLTWSDQPGFTTSSDRYSEEINRLLYGDVDAPHYPCRRVEHELPGVVNAIRLGGAA